MNKKITILVVALILIITSALSGCVDNTQEPNSANTDDAQAVSDDILTITDAYGRTVSVPTDVQRTLCVGAGCLRYLCYLGEQDTVVGVEDIEQREEDAHPRPYRLANPQFGDKQKYPYIGAFRGNYDAESILSLDPAPQVIFLTYSTAEGADKLSTDVGGIPVAGLEYGDTAKDFNDMKESLRLMGTVMARPERAEDVIRFIEDEIKEIDSRTRGEDAANLYIGGTAYRGSHGILSTQPDYPPFGYVNANNIASGTSKTGDWEGYQIGDDALLQWDMDPGIDYVFLDLSIYDFSETGNPNTNEKYGVESLCEGGVYGGLEAAQNNQVYGVLPYNWYTTNHGNVLADAWYVAKQLCPEKFSDIDPEDKANEIYGFLYSGCPVNESIYEGVTESFGHGFGPIELE
ncbi:MAG: ABC transporter substrate-binding protein [Euryarchaeota archaeon]|nr:ABC transporter substrate-binding protein [Euryarchaeota archaeon]